jgi:hypothetical protein
MGAYYTPTCQITNTKFETVSSDSMGGAKLLEHSYFNCDLVDKSIFMIENGTWKNKPFQWSCDYSDPELDNNNNFYDISKPVNVKTKFTDDWNYFKDSFNDVIILNNSTKEFIDLAEYKFRYPGNRSDLVHPLPLLTNSETKSMGGGDYHIDNPFRGSWKNGLLQVVRSIQEVPLSYENISNIIFSENENGLELVNDEILLKTIRNDVEIDLSTSSFEISTKFDFLGSDATKEEIINALRENEISELRFYKANGEEVIRYGNLDKDYDCDSSSSSNNYKYVWFKDIDNNGRLKRFVFDNFISLKNSE